MIRTLSVSLAAALLPLAAFAAAAPATPATPAAPATPVPKQAWVAESDANAQVLLDLMARFAPEAAANLGVEGHDEEVLDLGPKIYERQKKANEEAVKELQSRLAKATDPSVKQDLEIMIQSTQDNLETNRLQEELTLPYFPASRMVFGGLRSLLDPRISPERQAHAVGRLSRYAGLTPNTKPFTQLARDRTEEKLGKKGLLPPFKGELEQHLADSPRLVAGLKDLFAKSGLKGWEAPLATLEQQLADYDAWVREKLLPIARADHTLPPALYADSLKQFGVDVPPEFVKQRALVAFLELQNQMQAIAPKIAAEHKFKATDYRSVMKELKKKQVVGDKILPLYTHRLEEIEKIIRREGIVTLPDRKAKIKLASEAESAMQPAPNMRPPRLIGNTGEYGEFLLPLTLPSKDGKAGLRMDDFTHESSAWTLTAHEARPGHELQFSAMVEKGVSIARAVFAFNSVNVEGWGLYSEAEMQPYEPLDGQLFAMQNRLLRAARAFLDPMVNLGEVTPEKVKEVLMTDVGLSEGMAQQEVDRYTFRAPGQATAYFYGYQRLMETRTLAQLALRDKFNRKAFNDFVLSQGLLPPKLLQKAVLENFVPSQK